MLLYSDLTNHDYLKFLQYSIIIVVNNMSQFIIYKYIDETHVSHLMDTETTAIEITSIGKKDTHVIYLSCYRTFWFKNIKAN